MYRPIICCILPLLLACESNKKEIDPSGTYALINPVASSNTRVGIIQVKKIDQKKIAFTFDLNNGFPDHNNTSFVDTINLHNNSASYSPNGNKDYVIYFNFQKDELEIIAENSVEVNEIESQKLSGVYQKISNEQPVLIDPLTGEQLK